ncbi:MAG: type IV toxin-antitoxin system AbiEi family antitoxin domain-containing protein [Acidimicrobiia bacterium]
MDPRVLHLAAEQLGVLSHRQTDQLGVSRRRLAAWARTGALTEMHAGVYRVVGVPPSWSQGMLAAVLATDTADGLASHRGAARLWHPDGVATERLEVVVPHGWGRRLEGVLVHESRLLLPEDRRVVDGIPVTGPELTLLHLGAVLRPEAVEHALDDALRRQLTTLPRLRWRLTVLGRRGRNGTATLRKLLAARAPEVAVPESVLERRFLRLIREFGLPEPLGQWTVPGIGRTDFAWPEHHLVVELDGLRFHSSRRQLQDDSTRQNALTSRGLTVLRFTWQDVHEYPERTVRLVASVLAGRKTGNATAR